LPAREPHSSHERFSAEHEVSAGSERAFGLVFTVVLGGVGVWILLFGTRWPAWPWLGAASVLLALSLCAPRVLAPLNRAWFRFGLRLHAVVNPVILGFVFFCVVTPIGLLARLVGKDFLRLRRDPKATSYWIERDPPGPAPESLRDQF
jgi:hypothetical protein